MLFLDHVIFFVTKHYQGFVPKMNMNCQQSNFVFTSVFSGDKMFFSVISINVKVNLWPIFF